MTFLNTIKESILNTLFPNLCVGCGESGKPMCIECIASSRIAERDSPDWIYPVFDYRHPPIKKALHLFKYKNKKNFAEIFAGILYGKILEEISELGLMKNFAEPLLMPIPLSKERLRERGYNQTELICKELIKLDKNQNFKLIPNLLLKPRKNEHQARIKNKMERLKNIIGSFSINTQNKELIKGKNIILIDDILTTGATLTEAKKTLKEAGARKIIAFTVAH